MIVSDRIFLSFTFFFFLLFLSFFVHVLFLSAAPHPKKAFHFLKKQLFKILF